MQKKDSILDAVLGSQGDLGIIMGIDKRRSMNMMNMIRNTYRALHRAIIGPANLSLRSNTDPA